MACGEAIKPASRRIVEFGRLVSSRPPRSSRSPVERDLVLDLGHAGHRPCGVLREIAFVRVFQLASERDLAAVGVNRKILRLEGSDALKRLFDLFAHFINRNVGLDLDLIRDTENANNAMDSMVGGSLLVVPINLARQRDPSLLNGQLDPVILYRRRRMRDSAPRARRSCRPPKLCCRTASPQFFRHSLDPLDPSGAA